MFSILVCLCSEARWVHVCLLELCMCWCWLHPSCLQHCDPGLSVHTPLHPHSAAAPVSFPTGLVSNHWIMSLKRPKADTCVNLLCPGGDLDLISESKISSEHSELSLLPTDPKMNDFPKYSDSECGRICLNGISRNLLGLFKRRDKSDASHSHNFTALLIISLFIEGFGFSV